MKKSGLFLYAILLIAGCVTSTNHFSSITCVGRLIGYVTAIDNYKRSLTVRPYDKEEIIVECDQIGIPQYVRLGSEVSVEFKEVEFKKEGPVMKATKVLRIIE